jgi:hypothetical protein
LYCPHCGKEILDEKAVYCPYCAKPLVLAPQAGVVRKRTGFPTAAGILTIIAACISIFIGTVGIIDLGTSFAYYYGFAYAFFFMGIFGILAFAFGLTGGIFSIKRIHFALSIVGISLVLVSGFVTIIELAAMGNYAWVVGLLFGLPIVLLSLLGVIFAGISKGEFT